jgi:hypothetical protein
MLTRRYVNKKIGDKLVIWINPEKIEYYIGKNVPFIDYTNTKLKKFDKLRLFVQKKITALSPFIIPDKYYTVPKRLDNLDKYLIVKDIIDNGKSWRNSIWYKSFFHELNTNGEVNHKNITIKSEDELDHFFEYYVCDLIDSMSSKGYDIQKNSQIGNIMIGKNGELHKSNAGDHRFFVAKLTNTSSMPFKVKGIHKEWARSKNISSNKKGLLQLCSELEKIEQQYK